MTASPEVKSLVYTSLMTVTKWIWIMA